MQTYFISNNHTEREDHFPHRPIVLALGFFDGVHVGHEEVIKTAVQKAKENNLASAVMTFSPHPKEVLSNGVEKVDMISTFTQKEKLIYDLGVDYLYVVQFNKQFASISPESFVEDYILHLQAKHVVVGFDFTYGSRGKGNIFTLREQGKSDFSVTVIDKIGHCKEKISSTLIRQTIRNGQIERANCYLNRDYTTEGFVNRIEESNVVISNFPNILPKTGIYNVRIEMNQHWEQVNLTVYCNNERRTISAIHRTSHFPFGENDQVTVHWLNNNVYEGPVEQRDVRESVFV